jgi:L-lactate dehydrogenase complex protein LldG
MNAREAILSKIKSQIAGNAGDEARRIAIADRLRTAPKGIIPNRGQLDAAGRVDLFCDRAEAVQATVVRVGSPDDIPTSVSEYLRQKNLPQTIRMGDDQRLQTIDWSVTPQLTTETGPSDGNDPTGLSHATAGVAETGTLVLTSGPENPTTLNFLPESHIVVINAADIDGDYETALGRIREVYGKGHMPRIVNLITGPSRSADIEQKLLLGAHGPRSLHIILVNG